MRAMDFSAALPAASAAPRPFGEHLRRWRQRRGSPRDAAPHPAHPRAGIAPSGGGSTSGSWMRPSKARRRLYTEISSMIVLQL
jgi:hypothetical protein